MSAIKTVTCPICKKPVQVYEARKGLKLEAHYANGKPCKGAGYVKGATECKHGTA